MYRRQRQGFFVGLWWRWLKIVLNDAEKRITHMNLKHSHPPDMEVTKDSLLNFKNMLIDSFRSNPLSNTCTYWMLWTGIVHKSEIYFSFEVIPELSVNIEYIQAMDETEQSLLQTCENCAKQTIIEWMNIIAKMRDGIFLWYRFCARSSTDFQSE